MWEIHLPQTQRKEKRFGETSLHTLLSIIFFVKDIGHYDSQKGEGTIVCLVLLCK